MQNKLTLAIVVIVAIFLGVAITVQQANSPIMHRMVAQQEEILNLQRKFDRQAGTPAGNIGDLAALSTKVDTILTILRPLQAMQAQQAQQQAPQEPSDEYTKVHAIDVSQSPVKGNKKAPITIVEFLDFQCPFCGRFHPAVNEVLAAYPDKVNYVLKNYPLGFHPNARPAAKAALAAGEQGKYYEMVELLLKNNQDLNEEKYKELAKGLGLNVDKFMKDLKEKDAQWEQIIEADMKLGEQVEVRGTPTYFINGRKTTARDLNSYKKEIDSILSGSKS